MKSWPLHESPSYSGRVRLTHLAELGGAALGDLALQHADELAQLHAVVQLLHEELRSHLLAWKGLGFLYKKTRVNKHGCWNRAQSKLPLPPQWTLKLFHCEDPC